MKNKFRFFELLVLFAFAFSAVGCDDDDPAPAPEPPKAFELKVEVGNVTPAGADITITPSDTSLSYSHIVLPAEGLKDLADDELLSRLANHEELMTAKGVYKITAAEMEKQSPLNPETEYLVCAYREKVVRKQVFTTAVPNYDVKVASKFCEMSYWADFHKIGKDNYTLYMGTADHEGLYVKGEGEFIMFSLTAPHIENYMDAKVVSGNFPYDPDGMLEEMTLNGVECIRIVYGPEKDANGYFVETKYKFSGGKLTIEEKEGQHKVRFTGALENGQTISIDYEGVVAFTNNYASLVPAQIDVNKEFVCGYGEAAAQSGNIYSLDLMAGEDPNLGGGWTLRDRMQVILRAEGEGTSLPEGTYPVEAGEKLNTVQQGDFTIEENSSYVSGSFYYFVDEEFESTYGFFKSGNITIKREAKADPKEDIYHIKVDAVDANGHTVKASYDGKLKIYNDREEVAGASRRVARLNPRTH